MIFAVFGRDLWKGATFPSLDIMKTKSTILTLCACSIALLPAQTATPEKPAAETPAAETPAAETPAAETAEKEVKPETPVEKLAFKIFDLVSSFPDVVTPIKDDASIAAAKTKLDEIGKKLEAEAEKLKKLEVPANEARKKLKAKLESKQKVMEQKMQGIMTTMSQLDQATAMKASEMLQSFGMKMQTLGPTMEKYFEPDPEKNDEKGE